MAEESKCVKAKVGAIMVKDGRIISSGVNGSPSGHINCCDIYNQKDSCDINHPEYDIHKQWSAENEIHAEVNALTKAGALDELQDKFYIFVNKMPCKQCQKMLALYRPIAVYYYDEIDTIDQDSILNKVGVANINVAKLENKTKRKNDYEEIGGAFAHLVLDNNLKYFTK